MKAGALLVLSAVGLGAAPLLLPGVDWVGMPDVERVLAGVDLRKVAAEIAEREFSPNVSLSVLSRGQADRVTGEFGETIRAEPGHVFERHEVLLTNLGRLDVSVHTYHFRAQEEAGRAYRAETGIAAKFEVMQVSQGSSAQGVVVFEVPRDAVLSALLWQGEIAEATAPLAS